MLNIGYHRTRMTSLGILLAACSVALTTADIVDMSHDFETNKTLAWPGNKPFSTQNEFGGEITAGGKKMWFEIEEFEGSTHAGTHMDAPMHLVNSYSASSASWASAQIPPERFIAPLRIVNVQDQASSNPGYQLQVSDLASHERQHGRIPRHAVVVMNSGWGQYWTDKKRYFGPDYEQQKLIFPGFSAAALEWLVRYREPYGVGVDTASTDPGNVLDFPVHRLIGANNLYGLENLDNVEKVPEAGATIFAFPMKIAKGSGAPVRVVAIWGDSRGVLAGAPSIGPSILSLLVVCLLARLLCIEVV